jgi:glycosyltransferase involved in cell wall biosynthesis
MNPSPISIIVPIYNTAETLLRKCIDSILSQTFTDFELILVDDCSTDHCPKICDDYAKKDSRIKVIHNQQNLGCPQSREVGLKEAQGEYILFFDSDDLMVENMLEELHRAVKINNADFAYCDYYQMDSDRNTLEEIQQGNIADTTIAIKDIFSLRMWGVIWNKLVKKSIMDKIVFPSYFMHEDEVITIQLLSYAQQIHYVEKPLVYFNFHLHNENCEDNVEETKNFTQIIQFLKEKQGDLSIFEPELSNRINKCKLWLVNHKYSEIRTILRDFYPESNKRILSKTYWYIDRLDKFRLFCAVYRLPLFPFLIYVKCRSFLGKIRYHITH